jgi:hypothetical protein
VKATILILALLASFGSLEAKAPAKKISRADILATVKHRDALVKQLESSLDDADAQLAQALVEKDKALASLNAATKTDIPSLQGQINQQAKEKAAALKDAADEKAKADKLAKEVFWFKLPLAVCAAGCVALLLLKFGVPTLSPPYGIAITLAAPPIVFGLVMLL